MTSQEIIDKIQNFDATKHADKRLVSAFALFGAIYAARGIYNLGKSFLKYFVLPRRDLKSRYGGGWALVTGSSDGIGKAYAFELAKSGFNIILMARNQQKLDDVAKEIRMKYPSVSTKTVVFDFVTLNTEEKVKELQDILGALKQDISILINNVGVARVGLLDKMNFGQISDQLWVNINSQTFMTQAILPRFLKRESRSAIIDLSSVVAYTPSANTAIYAATKSYNFALSNAIRKSYPEKIDVMTVTPASVKTQMNSGRYCMTVTAEAHGKAVIDQLGWQSVTWGHWMHAIGPFITTYTPIGYFITRANAARYQVFLAENAAKKAAEEAKEKK